MKAVADTLAVARSNLVERVARPTKPHRAYRKAADEPLLVLIRRLVDERPTYGYRRITRLALIAGLPSAFCCRFTSRVMRRYP